MKLLKKIPLHTQIIIALILGAVFGSIFSVDHFKLKVIYREDGKQKETYVKSWDEIRFIVPEDGEEKNLRSFGRDDQIQIIKFYKKMSRLERKLSVFAVVKNGKEKRIENVLAVKNIDTPATYIRPVGTVFIRLLSFLAIPLVIASLIIGAASLEDIKKLGRIGGRTFLIYLSTTAVAITIGLTAANLIKPGKQIDEGTKNRLLGEYQSDTEAAIESELDIDIIDFFVNIVPKNPINAMADGNMLQIVFFAVLFGITLTFIQKSKAQPVIGFFNGVSETMIKMVDFIMLLAPYGVFALISATIAEFGFSIITTLIWYIFAVILGLLLQTTVVYSLLVKFFGKMNLLHFFKGIRNAQAIGFSTSSSAATLPVTFECTEKNLGLPKQVTGFVLPLGATINMDGTALYQGVAAVFIGQVYGLDLDITQQLTVVLTAVLASIGTAPVPGVGIIMLVMILQAVHIPAEGIALILGVDRILDMMRTVTNVTGDASVAAAIAGLEARKE